jgi:hypothetical protein
VESPSYIPGRHNKQENIKDYQGMILINGLPAFHTKGNLAVEMQVKDCDRALEMVYEGLVSADLFEV